MTVASVKGFGNRGRLETIAASPDFVKAAADFFADESVCPERRHEQP